MDIELFLTAPQGGSSVNSSPSTAKSAVGVASASVPSQTITPATKIKVRLIVEVNGTQYEKSIDGPVDTLKPLVQKLNTKIKKQEESNHKKTHPQLKSGSSLNLFPKNSMASTSSPSLSLNSLTSTFSAREIKDFANSNSSNSSSQDTTTFGVSIDTLVAREKPSNEPKIPTFVKNVINHLFLYGLGIEGLFRVSGSQVEIQTRKSSINKGDYNFIKEDNPHVITVLFKQFLRDLPEPLCTHELYDCFLATSDQINADITRDNGYEVLKKTIQMMPVNNRVLLQHIIYFLTFVSANQSINLMGPVNLSRVFGLNIFWKKEVGQMDIQKLQAISEKVNFITEKMIQNYSSIFEDSGALIAPSPSSSLSNSSKKLFLNAKLLGHKKSIQWMVLTDKQQKVWSLDSYGNCRIWDSQTHQFIKEFQICEGAVYQMISASNNTVWTATGKSVKIWDANGGLIGEIPGESYSLCESQYGEIWVGSAQVLNIYNLEDVPTVANPDELFKPIGTDLFMKGTFILAMCRVSSNRIWGCSSERSLFVWDSKTKETIHQAEIQEKRPKRMTCVETDESETIWIGGDEGTIQIFDSITFKLVHKISNQGWDKIFHIANINKEIWTSTWDTYVRVFDPKSRETLSDYSKTHSDVVSTILEVPNLHGGDSFVWFGSYDKSVTVYTFKENNKWLLSNFKKSAPRPQGIRPVGFSSRLAN
ncbi:hypothetical protein CYY_002913 [Polysphondylium violaceum]|uniref:Rho-GAP domain-containing protein n=1 Tax=Polysphondylium violaceum TaxID=133409 RepID=A0A8J4V0J3_9MYCE|nr:hypothetical protein CYY_002913 [Polysphondylium violaceum]